MLTKHLLETEIHIKSYMLLYIHSYMHVHDDVYLIKLQEVLQNLSSTLRMQISQICGISKENRPENNKSHRYNRTAQR
jgi:hypothetical protein